MKITDKDVGEKIRKFRVFSNMSQEELGKCIGIKKQSMSNIELGKRSVSYLEMQTISEKLNVPIAYITRELGKFDLIDTGGLVKLPKFIYELLVDTKKYFKYLNKEEAKEFVENSINEIKKAYEEVIKND